MRRLVVVRIVASPSSAKLARAGAAELIVAVGSRTRASIEATQRAVHAQTHHLSPDPNGHATNDRIVAE
jgi:hypothetical protein